MKLQFQIRMKRYRYIIFFFIIAHRSACVYNCVYTVWEIVCMHAAYQCRFLVGMKPIHNIWCVIFERKWEKEKKNRGELVRCVDRSLVVQKCREKRVFPNKLTSIYTIFHYHTRSLRIHPFTGVELCHITRSIYLYTYVYPCHGTRLHILQLYTKCMLRMKKRYLCSGIFHLVIVTQLAARNLQFM